MKENFKKLFAVVLAVAMLAAQIVVPTNAATTYYCSNSECKNAGVKGELLHKIEATCKDGFEIYACARQILDEDDKPTGEICDGTITVRIAATGAHTADGITVPADPHTCTEDGNYEYQTCKGCEVAYLVNGTWVDSYVDEASGHDYEGVVTAPNCTEGGFTTYTCSVCDDSYTDDEVACTGHKFETKHEAQAATCKETGWKEYYTCSNPNCDAIDPERPFVEEPIQDHGLRVVDTKAASCTEDGYNKFQCNEPTCPYYNGVTENLPAPGHQKVSVKAVPAACGVVGYKKHYKCTVCNCLFSSTSSDTVRDLSYFEVDALEHTEVLVGFRPATCTEDGLTNAIVCDRVGCGFVHHAGDVIPATGHTLTLVPEVLPECFEDGHTESGNIEHKHCSVCEKNFAKETENMDIEAEALATVVTTTDHESEKMVIAPKCTEQGYTVYTCKKCHYTYSEAIAEKGHDFGDGVVKEVAAKCEETGVKAHNKCITCNKLFAADANPADIAIKEVKEADLTIKALGHKYEEVSAVNPTYTETGNTAGEKCERCNKPNPENPAEPLAKLQQAVKFYYELSGVKGAKDAVNSGYVTLKVYFDVLADAVNDKEAYNSDVLAEIYGIDFAINYNKDVFELTYVDDTVSPFGNFAATVLKTANENGKVSVSQDTAANIDGKTFRGEKNLLTVLTFQVNDSELIAGEYDFTAEWNVTNPDDDVIAGTSNVATTESEITDKIAVKMLGDANGSGTYSSADTMLISQFIKANVEGDKYVAEYDMNKDGFIDGKDLNLIRRAAVTDDAYKAIEVDPNATVTSEV